MNNTIITDKTGQVYRIVEQIDANSFIVRKEKDFKSTMRKILTENEKSSCHDRTVLFKNRTNQQASFLRSCSEALTVARVNEELGLMPLEPGIKPHMIPQETIISDEGSLTEEED